MRCHETAALHLVIQCFLSETFIRTLITKVQDVMAATAVKVQKKRSVRINDPPLSLLCHCSGLVSKDGNHKWNNSTLVDFWLVTSSQDLRSHSNLRTWIDNARSRWKAGQSKHHYPHESKSANHDTASRLALLCRVNAKTWSSTKSEILVSFQEGRSGSRSEEEEDEERRNNKQLTRKKERIEN